jgi:hypothetical protein
MTDTPSPKPTNLAADEKLTPVMIYTINSLIRGSVVTKENIRVSIWLRMAGAPEFIHLKNANVLIFGISLQSQNFSDYFLSTHQILAFHLLPPAVEPVDYDESEVNRKMEPLTVMVGSFRFNGHTRMSTQTDLATHLSIVKSPLLSIYDIEITNPNLQAMGVLKVPFTLVRTNQVAFGARSV